VTQKSDSTEEGGQQVARKASHDARKTPSWALPPKPLRFLIIILLVLNIFFRFANLDRKVYWFDEVFTSKWISGYTEKEVVQQVYDGRIIGVEDLQKYQRLSPEKGLSDTINALAAWPENPPLYYLMARFWMQLFHDSVTTPRGLSAVSSLLVFPGVYWLCLELFGTPLMGWMAIALISVSPIYVLFAQEARAYSLWTVTILLSSWALLRAMRLNTKLNWGIYAVTLAISFYVHLYSALVAIGHAVYLVATEGFRWSKTVKSYLLASLAGLLAFGFWPLVIILHQPSIEHSVNLDQNLRLHMLNRWANYLTRVFIDFGRDVPHSLTEALPMIPLILIVLGLEGYAIYFLYRQTPKKVWLFILAVLGVTAASMLIGLILGELRISAEARYLFPCYLAIQLAVAYLLLTKITSFSVNNWEQKLWQLVTILVVSAGVVSCALSSQAEYWWNKGYLINKYNREIAGIVNKATQPLLVSDTDQNYLLSLSYLLDSKVRLQLVETPNIPMIPEMFSDVFLYNPSQTLRSRLEKEQNYKIVAAQKNDNIWLWRLAR
jgi:uncharacterized membrane protein